MGEVETGGGERDSALIEAVSGKEGDRMVAFGK